MKTLLLIVNILISVLIVLFILLQRKGVGLGSAWGGQGELYQTRRGIEKITFQATVFLIILFFFISLFNLF